MKYAAFPFPFLASLFLTLNPNAAMSRPNVTGFIFPTGGGSSFGDNGDVKGGVLSFHKAALVEFDKNLNAGAKVGKKICVLEYNKETPEGKLAAQTEQDLFVKAGLKDASRFATYFFSYRQDANNKEKVAQVTKECGLLFLPGGDQNLIRSVWQKTLLATTVQSILQNGGGIISKSAGAAVTGSVVYYPHSDSTSAPSDILSHVDAQTAANGEIEQGFLSTALPQLPALYVETHSGERERSARAIGILAAWESTKQKPGPRALSLAVDVDTGALIRFDNTRQVWFAEVYGSRSVEFSFPQQNSQSGLTQKGQPFYTNLVSSTLLEGDKIILSGSEQGTVTDAEGKTYPATGQNAPKTVSHYEECAKALPQTTTGAFYSSGEESSQVVFKAANAATGTLEDPESIQSAYATGDFVPEVREQKGCGLWISRSYVPEEPDPANRLAMQRFSLGSDWVDFAVGLPSTMKAVKTNETTVQFVPESEGANGSSLLLFDTRKATRKSTGTYIYKEFESESRKRPVSPIQIGSWIGGRTHLLSPNATFSITTGEVNLK